MPPELLPSTFLLPAWQQGASQTTEPIEITTGQTLSLLIMLPLMCLSIVAGIKWLVAILQRQHPLPHAGRGLPRIPGLLTVVTIFITLLQMVAVWSATIAPADSIPPGSGATATADSEADAKPQTPPELDEKTRATAWQILIASLVMNLVVCIPMAIVVLNGLLQGRELANTPAVVVQAPATPLSNDDDWQDLDADPLRTAPEPTAVTAPESSLGIATPLPLNPPAPAPFSFSRELLFAVEVMLAAYFPTMLLRFLLVLIMQAVTGDEAPSNPLLEMITGGADGGLLAMIIFLGIIVAPLAEELQFRVVLLGGLLQSPARWLALAVSSVTFSLLHGLPDGLALLPLAFALGYAFERRQSYLTVVLVHFLFNCLNLGLAFCATS
jgi:membrane protease YdiL (CAAX protease family)